MTLKIQFPMKWRSESHSVMSDSLRPHGLYKSMEFSRPESGVSSCSLLLGIFPTQGLNPGLPHCRQILHQLSHQESFIDLASVSSISSISNIKSPGPHHTNYNENPIETTGKSQDNDTTPTTKNLMIENSSVMNNWASLMAQSVKSPPAKWETGKVPWRRAWQPTPVFLPGESPCTEGPGGLQSMGSQRVGHDWATKHNE